MTKEEDVSKLSSARQMLHYEELFQDRFTDKDPDFVAHCDKKSLPPPALPNFITQPKRIYNWAGRSRGEYNKRSEEKIRRNRSRSRSPLRKSSSSSGSRHKSYIMPGDRDFSDYPMSRDSHLKKSSHHKH